MSAMKQKHITEMNTKDKTHADDMATLKKKLADTLAQLKASHETEMEGQRKNYTDQNNGLSSSLRSC